MYCWNSESNFDKGSLQHTLILRHHLTWHSVRHSWGWHFQLISCKLRSKAGLRPCPIIFHCFYWLGPGPSHYSETLWCILWQYQKDLDEGFIGKSKNRFFTVPRTNIQITKFYSSEAVCTICKLPPCQNKRSCRNLNEKNSVECMVLCWVDHFCNAFSTLGGIPVTKAKSAHWYFWINFPRSS